MKWRLGLATVVTIATSTGTAAQVPPPPVPPPVLHFNPSSPSVVPQAPEMPVSPGPGPGAAAVSHGIPDVVDPHPASHYSRHGSARTKKAFTAYRRKRWLDR